MSLHQEQHTKLSKTMPSNPEVQNVVWDILQKLHWIAINLNILSTITKEQAKLPTIWKSAMTCPIPKVNPSKAIEKDLRTILLTCILSKELETHPVNWLQEIVLPHIDQFQFGAMARCSTVHVLVEMCHDWFRVTDSSKDMNFVHTVLVDVRPLIELILISYWRNEWIITFTLSYCTWW